MFTDVSCQNATDCDPNAYCSNLEPHGHNCTCKDGFIGDGRRCDGKITWQDKEVVGGEMVVDGERERVVGEQG